MLSRSAALFALVLCATSATAQETPRTISVSGEGEVSATPDIARITTGVQMRAEAAGDAMRMASEAMAKVFAALDAQGVDPADVQTSRLSLDPVWDDDPQPRTGSPDVVGYVAGNMVSVRLRDVGAIGSVVDALVVAGANRFESIGFGIEDPKPMLEEARRAAVADARGKAELLADAAGLTLGPVLSLNESGGFRPQPMFAQADMARGAPVAEGTMSLGAQVQIVYAIE
jgi:uncharacterized protein YggE